MKISGNPQLIEIRQRNTFCYRYGIFKYMYLSTKYKQSFYWLFRIFANEETFFQIHVWRYMLHLSFRIHKSCYWLFKFWKF